MRQCADKIKFDVLHRIHSHTRTYLNKAVEKEKTLWSSRGQGPDKAARPTERTKPGLDKNNINCFGNKMRTQGLPVRPKNSRRTPRGHRVHEDTRRTQGLASVGFAKRSQRTGGPEGTGTKTAGGHRAWPKDNWRTRRGQLPDTRSRPKIAASVVFPIRERERESHCLGKD